MSIVRKIEIDGQDVLFKASAAIPRIYRLKFQRDIYKDYIWAKPYFFSGVFSISTTATQAD